jgi:peptide/nickel transport system substrate-binding protein
MEQLSPAEEERTKQVSVRGQRFAKFFNQEERYNTRPMGTGPYVIERWDRNARVVLRRRDDHWDADHAGYLDRIVVRFITDGTTAMQALRAGEIDFFYRLTPEQFYDELGGPPGWIKQNYVKAEWFYPTYSYAGWNLRRPLFSDPRVRMALALLTDKQMFLETKLYGSGVLVSGSQYYFGPMYDHDVHSIAYDPDAALDLLAEVGWIDTDGDGILDKDGKPFAFTMLIPSGTSISEQYSEMMQYNLRRVGIRMEVLALEWASFVERMLNRNFDVVVLSWAMDLESDPFQLFHGSQAAPELRSSNHVGFKNKLADELIERIRVTLDEDERQKLNYSFHRLLDAEQPYTFLWTRKEFGVYHQRFRGVKFYPLRPGFDLREWYVPKELQ